MQKIQETSYGALVGTLVVLTIILVLLYGTGLGFHMDGIGSWNLWLHHFAAVSLLLLIGIHIWLNGCKMRKMRDGIVAILKGKDIKHQDNRGYLIEQLKQKSLGEICTLFDIDGKVIKQALLKRAIHVNNLEENFKAIAKANQKDMYELLIFILREHVQEKIESLHVDTNKPNKS